MWRAERFAVRDDESEEITDYTDYTDKTAKIDKTRPTARSGILSPVFIKSV